MYDNNIVHDNGILGTWGDTQIPNTYSHYADPVMETLLVKVLPVMKKETGLDLVLHIHTQELIKKETHLKDTKTDQAVRYLLR